MENRSVIKESKVCINMKHIKTVTVAISAFNEEKNIVNFLNSVLMQQENGFKIKEIWVHSDGSSDNTVKLAKQVKDKRIRVWDHKKRAGKSSWLNKIYKDLQTDILVQSDADVVFYSKLTIKNLIQPIIKNPKVMMCGGNPQPIKSETFIEECINSSFKVYEKLRSNFLNGNNKFSADGRLLAFRKEFIKKVYVPKDMIANDMFVYLVCRSFSYDYKFVKSAKVLFRSPQKLSDHIRQNTRFESAEVRMKRFFDKNLVDKETKIPLWMLTTYLLKQFLAQPFHSITILFINQYCRYKARKLERKLNAKWPMAVTTKGII